MCLCQILRDMGLSLFVEKWRGRDIWKLVLYSIEQYAEKQFIETAMFLYFMLIKSIKYIKQHAVILKPLSMMEL